MEQNALERNQTPFDPSASSIKQPDNQLGVKFDPFNLNMNYNLTLLDYSS